MLETVVRRAFRRRERLFALDAPVATAFPGSRPVESVPNDVPGADFFMRTTFGVETAQTFHSRGPCRRKNYVRRNQAQTLARRLVRAWPPTLDCGSTLGEGEAFGRQELCQGVAADELHGNEVHAIRFFHRIHVHDVRVVECRDRFGFALEASESLIGRHVFRQHFERDSAG